jgi:hypothetical protein
MGSKREVRKNKVIDFEDDFKKHLRCPNCKRLTSGIDEFKHIRTGKITKTCSSCRACVYKSLKSKSRPEHRHITIKEKFDAYELYLKYFDKGLREEMFSKMVEEHPDMKKVFKVLFDDKKPTDEKTEEPIKD